MKWFAWSEQIIQHVSSTENNSFPQWEPNISVKYLKFSIKLLNPQLSATLQQMKQHKTERIIPLSSGSALHFPAVCLKVPAFPSLLFQSDSTHLLFHPSSNTNIKPKWAKSGSQWTPQPRYQQQSHRCYTSTESTADLQTVENAYGLDHR